MLTRLRIASASRAQDAGYLALADVADLTGRLNIDYRVVGGHMVSLLVAAYQAEEAPSRETADADIGATFDVFADARLLPAILDHGYRAVAGNRFVRQEAGGQDLVIDLLAPSYTTRHAPNRHHGAFVVDEVPGLGLALSMDPLVLTLDVGLRAGGRLTFDARVPAPVPALAVKALAYRSRLAAKDAVDVWRLLEVASLAGVTASDWEHPGTRADARRVLSDYFGRRNASGTRAATAHPGRRTRIAFMAQTHVGSSPDRPS
jgi:hypothetical protein